MITFLNPNYKPNAFGCNHHTAFDKLLYIKRFGRVLELAGNRTHRPDGTIQRIGCKPDGKTVWVMCDLADFDSHGRQGAYFYPPTMRQVEISDLIGPKDEIDILLAPYWEERKAYMVEVKADEEYRWKCRVVREVRQAWFEYYEKQERAAEALERQVKKHFATAY